MHIRIEDHPQDNKPQYIVPSIESYSAEMLQQKLGPARAFSPTVIDPDGELFNDDY